MTAAIFALANQKGGVGKTTTTVNLGACLAAQGWRVLVVDNDPQSNATTSLNINPRGLTYSLYHVLINDLPIQEVLTLTDRLGLDLIPASTDLAGAEIELIDRPGRERTLANALGDLAQGYDYILIDNPPSLGLLTLNGLTAASQVIIPVQCEYLALEGLSLLLDTIRRVQAQLNPDLILGGVVLTMYDARTNLSQQVAAEVRTYFPDQIFETIIPRNIRLSEAPSHGQPVIGYAPGSPGAQAYVALAEEFSRRMPPLVASQPQAGESQKGASI